MKFDDADQVSQACWTMKQADYPRGTNRARINELFNGHPPYTEQEVQENNLAVNVNFLESTRLAHDARSQFANAFTKPGNFFGARTDTGPRHKRSTWGTIVTKEINRRMKKNLPYFEKNRSVFALDVLHGIGPATWADQEMWCPDPAGVEDILIPGKTLLTFKNLAMYAVYRSFSAPELIKLTRGPNVDPGWNQDLVSKCLEWIDAEAVKLMGTNWPEIWAPEKLSERIKSDGGFYVADQLPTIECFDFYFYDGEDEEAGWRRRIVLDSWAVSEGATRTGTRKAGDIYRNTSGFLYNGGTHKVADSHRNLMAFQFADLSAVAPFQYHSIRSLGFLLYAVCHLQNRLRCRFNEAVFEALMMYFRVKSMDDAQRALKVELVNRGFIEEGISPLTATERYQVNAPLVQFGLMQNQQIINENSSSYVQQPNYSEGGVEKTKFQVMAETNAMTSLVSSALNQAYTYQKFEYEEIFRRFCRPNSKDPDVRSFRAACLRQGVAESALTPEAWELEPERVMGAGNKTLEMTIAQQLMEWRDKFDPEPQREILRDAVLAITDDPTRAESLVPPSPVRVTDSVHDAQLTTGALMQGLPVAIKTGMNHIEYVETMMISLANVIQQAQSSGNVTNMEKLLGMQAVGQHIAEHIAIIAKDEKEKQRVKIYGDQLGKLMNEVKAFAQRLQKQMQEQAAQGNGGMDPKDLAKMKAMEMQAQQKVEQMKLSHAERTAERQVQFEMEEKRRQQQHELDLQREREMVRLELEADKQRMASELAADKVRIQAEVEAKDLTTAAEVRAQKKKTDAQAEAIKNKPQPKPKSKSSE